MTDIIKLTQVNETYVKNSKGALVNTTVIEEIYINKSVINYFHRLREYKKEEAKMLKLGARSCVDMKHGYGYFTQTVEEIYSKCNEK